VKIARQLRLAGDELPAHVGDPFADLVARSESTWRDIYGAGEHHMGG
jgi:hypothetical protein